MNQSNSCGLSPAKTNPITGKVEDGKARDIAEKITKTLTGTTAPVIGFGEANGAGIGGSANIVMDIPVEKVGLVIGRAGTTIREIQDTCGVTLQLDSTGEPTRCLRIIGPRENVDKARDRIQKLISLPTIGAKIPNCPPKTMLIPSPYVGFVIGKGGDTIKRISLESGCRLQIESDEEAKRLGHTPPMPGHQFLHLVGTTEAVSKAENAVMDLLRRKQNAGTSGVAGYGVHHQHPYQMRAQPYPTYTSMAGYAHVAQQAYAFAPNAVQSFMSSNQMQGYGSCTPQTFPIYASYTAQIPQNQTASGYPPSCSIAPPHAPNACSSQPQHPIPVGQMMGYPLNGMSLQMPTQGYTPFSHKQVCGAVPGSQQVSSTSAQPESQQLSSVGTPNMIQRNEVGVAQTHTDQSSGVKQVVH